MNTEYQEDVNAAQADVIDRIVRKMVDVLDRYARENGYSVVRIPRRRALRFYMPPRRSTSRRTLFASTIRPTRSRLAPRQRNRSRPQQNRRRRRLSRPPPSPSDRIFFSFDSAPPQNASGLGAFFI